MHLTTYIIISFFVMLQLQIGEWEHLGVSALIYKGTLAKKGRFPYMVRVLASGNKCSGSIISTKTVLTAKHCLQRKGKRFRREQVKIAYGGVDLRQMPRYRVKDLLFPESLGFETDIVLIMMKRSVSSSIVPAIPAKGLEFPAGKKVLQVGWGKTPKDNRSPSLLRYANLVLGGMTDCGLHEHKRYLGNFCVLKVKGSDTCPGDSGGPTIVEAENGIDVVIGADWYGKGECWKEAIPVAAIVSKVSALTDWILKKGEGTFKIYHG